MSDEKRGTVKSEISPDGGLKLTIKREKVVEEVRRPEWVTEAKGDGLGKLVIKRKSNGHGSSSQSPKRASLQPERPAVEQRPILRLAFTASTSSDGNRHAQVKSWSLCELPSAVEDTASVSELSPACHLQPSPKDSGIDMSSPPHDDGAVGIEPNSGNGMWTDSQATDSSPAEGDKVAGNLDKLETSVTSCGPASNKGYCANRDTRRPGKSSRPTIQSTLRTRGERCALKSVTGSALKLANALAKKHGVGRYQHMLPVSRIHSESNAARRASLEESPTYNMVASRTSLQSLLPRVKTKLKLLSNNMYVPVFDHENGSNEDQKCRSLDAEKSVIEAIESTRKKAASKSSRSEANENTKLKFCFSNNNRHVSLESTSLRCDMKHKIPKLKLVVKTEPSVSVSSVSTEQSADIVTVDRAQENLSKRSRSTRSIHKVCEKDTETVVAVRKHQSGFTGDKLSSPCTGDSASQECTHNRSKAEHSPDTVNLRSKRKATSCTRQSASQQDEPFDLLVSKVNDGINAEQLVASVESKSLSAVEAVSVLATESVSMLADTLPTSRAEEPDERTKQLTAESYKSEPASSLRSGDPVPQECSHNRSKAKHSPDIVNLRSKRKAASCTRQSVSQHDMSCDLLASKDNDDINAEQLVASVESKSLSAVEAVSVLATESVSMLAETLPTTQAEESDERTKQLTAESCESEPTLVDEASELPPVADTTCNVENNLHSSCSETDCTDRQNLCSVTQSVLPPIDNNKNDLVSHLKENPSDSCDIVGITTEDLSFAVQHNCTDITSVPCNGEARNIDTEPQEAVPDVYDDERHLAVTPGEQLEKIILIPQDSVSATTETKSDVFSGGLVCQSASSHAFADDSAAKQEDLDSVTALDDVNVCYTETNDNDPLQIVRLSATECGDLKPADDQISEELTKSRQQNHHDSVQTEDQQLGSPDAGNLEEKSSSLCIDSVKEQHLPHRDEHKQMVGDPANRMDLPSSPLVQSAEHQAGESVSTLSSNGFLAAFAQFVNKSSINKKKSVNHRLVKPDDSLTSADEVRLKSDGCHKVARQKLCGVQRRRHTCSENRTLPKHRSVHSARRQSLSNIECVGDSKVHAASSDDVACLDQLSSVVQEDCVAISKEELQDAVACHHQLVSLRLSVCTLLETVLPESRFPTDFQRDSACVEQYVTDVVNILSDSAALPKAVQRCSEPVVLLHHNPNRCLQSLQQLVIRLLTLLLPDTDLSDLDSDSLDMFLELMTSVNRPLPGTFCFPRTDFCPGVDNNSQSDKLPQETQNILSHQPHVDSQSDDAEKSLFGTENNTSVADKLFSVLPLNTSGPVGDKRSLRRQVKDCLMFLDRELT